MSGLLDRMVLRARGALPAVEPVVAPRFAPAAEGFTGTSNEFEAPARATEAMRRQTRIGLVQPNAISQTVEGRALGIPEQQSPISSARMHPENVGKPVSMHTDQTEFAEDSAGVFESADAVVNQKRVVQSTIKKGLMKVEESEPPTVQASMLERRKSGIEEIIASSANDSAAERPVPALEKAIAVHKDLPAGGDPLGPPAEQHTDIHISIGSIELRAPQPEARSQTVPFRPRVTLNEFLRRKPEAGA